MKSLIYIGFFFFAFSAAAQHPVFTSQQLEKLLSAKAGTVERKVVSYSGKDSSQFISLKRAENLEPNMMIPAECSPDADGKNDRVAIPATGASSTLLYIFDAAGKMVFDSGTGMPAWEGLGCEQGIFVYYLELKMKNGDKVTQKGNINLVK